MADKSGFFDYARLRNDLKEYYMTASSFGFSRKLIEVDIKRVDDASDEELLQIAEDEEFDVSGYDLEAM
ncbi:MAG: hypothetical protein IJQ26_07905 [Lachnospiraceae bacterium]|nr:hypothetical protein [Butyrivibrio sp.]MBQ6904432.1 hypothetical protein [Lachnospiraceae bacterium]